MCCLKLELSLMGFRNRSHSFSHARVFPNLLESLLLLRGKVTTNAVALL